MESTTSKKTIYVRVFLVTLLIGLLLYSFLGEKQPYNDGQGWDGRLYYQMCNNSLHDIFHHGYSTYYVHRFLPFAFVNGFQMIFGYEHTMFFMMLTLFIAIMVGVWGFFKISNYLQLNIGVETVAFAFIFFNHGLLRCGYSPYGTDVFALAMGIWFCYFFLRKEKLGMTCVAFAGAFIWQAIWPIACILFALPWDNYNVMQPRQQVNTIGNKMTELIKIGFILIPLVSLAYLVKICIKYGLPLSNYAEIIPYFYCESATSIVGLILSIIGFTAYIAFLLYPIHFDLFDAIKHLLKSLQIGYIIGAILLAGTMYGIVHVLGNTDIDNPTNMISAIRRILWEPLTFPLKFLEGHLLSFGLVIIFFLIYYKQILQVVHNHSYGYLFCLIYIVALGSQTEVRFIINMLPFLVFAIAQVMNQYNYRKWVTPIIIVTQLILSHFWFHINTPEILATTITEDDMTYIQYPLQRMFEYSGGPWQSTENYYKWISIFIIILIIVYYLHKSNKLYRQSSVITTTKQ